MKIPAVRVIYFQYIIDKHMQKEYQISLLSLISKQQFLALFLCDQSYAMAWAFIVVHGIQFLV